MPSSWANGHESTRTPRSPPRNRGQATVEPSSSTPPSVFNGRDAVERFADDTTIHGLKDLYRVWGENGFLKWTWVVLLAASTGAMMYEMIQVILNYLARPTATQIAQMYLESYTYPRMLFCPRRWINATRIKLLGMPKPVLAYALSFFYLYDVQPEPPIVDFRATASELQDYMDRYNFTDYFQLYTNISDDSERTMTCPSCTAWPLPKRVTEDGVCYVVELKPAKVSFLIEHPPQITYTPVRASARDTENWLPMYKSKHSTEQLYIGYKENDFYGAEAIKLSHDRSYIIKVTPSLQRRFAGYQLKTGRGCYDNETLHRMNHSQRMCYSDCEEWTYGYTCGKIRYLGYSYDRDEIVDTPPLWSSLTYKDPPDSEYDECKRREKPNYDACAARCLPPCEEWIYDTTVVAVNSQRMWIDKENAAVTVAISYQVKAGTLAVEEVSTYTYHTFLSNIGGQMGLWLGASVLSVFQLIFFLVRFTYEKWKDEHKQTGEARVGVVANGNHAAAAVVVENGHHWTARF